MAALLVCFSISTGHSPVELNGCECVGMCSSGVFMFMTAEDFGLKHWMCCSSCLWDFKEPRHGNIQITGQFQTFSSSKTGISNVNVFSGKVVSCCLGGCGSVLCHLNEWMIVNSAVPVCSSSVCICTLNFLKKKNHLLIWCFLSCLYTTLSHDDPQWWNTDHSLYSSCFFLVFF